MAKEPTIADYLDDEERELIEAIESDDYEFGPSLLTPEHKTELQAAASETKKEMRTKITLRVRNVDLAKLKKKAAEDGLPYQKRINSILHKAVN